MVNYKGCVLRDIVGILGVEISSSGHRFLTESLWSERVCKDTDVVNCRQGRVYLSLWDASA